MAQPVKFYFDLISQPCRALFMFMEASKIPYEPIPVSLLKGEHLTEHYKNNVNRFQKVPVIDDKGYKLSESVAIFRYLVREKLVPDHWYPRHTLLRGRVDEYMAWQHNNMRYCCTNYFRTKWLEPKKTKTEPNSTLINESEKQLNKCLDDFEKLWLKSDKYMLNSKITIADLLAITEIDQTKYLGFNPFHNRHKLIDWYELVKETMDPFYLEANQTLEKIAGGSCKNQQALKMKN